jgi:acetyl esterase/lipase
MGYSSGGYDCLMAALCSPSENFDSDDPVDHVSSKVQAAVAYYPMSDLNNFGKENVSILEHFHSIGLNFDAAFDFHSWNTATNRFERAESLDSIRGYYKRNSPINYVSDDDPPILLFHGTEDEVVPIQQSEIIIDKLEEHKVPCHLFTVDEEGHMWNPPKENEYETVVEWFNKHLFEKNTD